MTAPDTKVDRVLYTRDDKGRDFFISSYVENRGGKDGDIFIVERPSPGTNYLLKKVNDPKHPGIPFGEHPTKYCCFKAAPESPTPAAPAKFNPKLDIWMECLLQETLSSPSGAMYTVQKGTKLQLGRDRNWWYLFHGDIGAHFYEPPWSDGGRFKLVSGVTSPETLYKGSKKIRSKETNVSWKPGDILEATSCGAYWLLRNTEGDQADKTAVYPYNPLSLPSQFEPLVAPAAVAPAAVAPAAVTPAAVAPAVVAASVAPATAPAAPKLYWLIKPLKGYVDTTGKNVDIPAGKIAVVSTSSPKMGGSTCYLEVEGHKIGFLSTTFIENLGLVDLPTKVRFKTGTKDDWVESHMRYYGIRATADFEVTKDGEKLENGWKLNPGDINFNKHPLTYACFEPIEDTKDTKDTKDGIIKSDKPGKYYKETWDVYFPSKTFGKTGDNIKVEWHHDPFASQFEAVEKVDVAAGVAPVAAPAKIKLYTAKVKAAKSFSSTSCQSVYFDSGDLVTVEDTDKRPYRVWGKGWEFELSSEPAADFVRVYAMETKVKEVVKTEVKEVVKEVIKKPELAKAAMDLMPYGPPAIPKGTVVSLVLTNNGYWDVFVPGEAEKLTCYNPFDYHFVKFDGKSEVAVKETKETEKPLLRQTAVVTKYMSLISTKAHAEYFNAGDLVCVDSYASKWVVHARGHEFEWTENPFSVANGLAPATSVKDSALVCKLPVPAAAPAAAPASDPVKTIEQRVDSIETARIAETRRQEERAEKLRQEKIDSLRRQEEQDRAEQLRLETREDMLRREKLAREDKLQLEKRQREREIAARQDAHITTKRVDAVSEANSKRKFELDKKTLDNSKLNTTLNAKVAMANVFWQAAFSESSGKSGVVKLAQMMALSSVGLIGAATTAFCYWQYLLKF